MLARTSYAFPIMQSPGMGQVDYSTPVDTSGLPAPLQNIFSAFSAFGSNLGTVEWLILGVGAYVLFSTVLTTKKGVSGVAGAVKRRRASVRQRRLREAEEGGGFFGLL